MAKSKSFSVENPEALTNVLRNAAIATSESALRQGALAGARIFYREIKLRAMPHYRTGNLEDALLIAYVPEDSVAGKLATYTVTFNKKAWYARLLEYGKANRKAASAKKLEYGDSRTAATPFIRPAFEAKQVEAGQAVIDTIQEAVNSGS